MSAMQSEVEVIKEFEYNFPETGFIRIRLISGYHDCFPKGGFWFNQGDWFTIVLDVESDGKGAKGVELIAEIQREYWWPETIEA